MKEQASVIAIIIYEGRYMIFDNNIISEILNAEVIAIYGAGIMGKALAKSLMSNTYSKKIEAFIVQNTNENPKNIDGIPVIDVSHAEAYKKTIVLVALHEKNVNEAIDYLKKVEFQKLIPITFDSDLWEDIRGNWMYDEKIGFTENTEIVKGINAQTNIYVVHSNFDKPLKEKIKDQSYEKSILVGASSCIGKEYACFDNTGNNISEKNKEYCELTGLYWIWKNDKSEYVGLSHYRRRFVFDECLDNNISDVDVVVTIPVVNLNTVRNQYALDHDVNDWDILMEAIEQLYPEYYDTADYIQNGYYYYAYNMCIAKKSIIDNYCEWLFNILDYCEKRIKLKKDRYQDRYAGFLAERLMTIYFVHNKQYRIGVAKKHFIENQE